MSNLLKIAINNSLINEQINFSADQIIKNNVNKYARYSDISDLPIEAEESSWQTVQDSEKNYLSKTFNFLSEKHLLFFLNETIRKSNEINHHAKILVDKDVVQIELYTHDINDVTHLDLKLAEHMDELYDDIVFLNQD